MQRRQAQRAGRNGWSQLRGWDSPPVQAAAAAAAASGTWRRGMPLWQEAGRSVGGEWRRGRWKDQDLSNLCCVGVRVQRRDEIRLRKGLGGGGSKGRREKEMHKQQDHLTVGARGL